MPNRYCLLREILDKRQLFKVVCGAGNEDFDEVRKLSKIYTLAGALMIDVSANVNIVEACNLGIDEAFVIASAHSIKLEIRPFINVSVGIKGDPHVRKAKIIPDNCVSCSKCISVCEQSAISSEPKINLKRCIGCGACEKACEFGAIEFETLKKELNHVLPSVIEEGAETIELHGTVEDDTAVLPDWIEICSILKNNFVSFCLDRSELSDKNLLHRITNIFNISKERTIIQADGNPMSGSADDFKTTLQAIATAELVNRLQYPIKILASGGTNSKTKRLADLCDVPINGVSIGTYARKLVSEETSHPQFDHNKKILSSAITKATELVSNSLKGY